MFFAKGQCDRGVSCLFAHSREEQRHVPNLWKTKPCVAFQRGACGHADGDCRYAHSRTWRHAELVHAARRASREERAFARSASFELGQSAAASSAAFLSPVAGGERPVPPFPGVNHRPALQSVMVGPVASHLMVGGPAAASHGLPDEEPTSPGTPYPVWYGVPGAWSSEVPEGSLEVPEPLEDHDLNDVAVAPSQTSPVRRTLRSPHLHLPAGAVPEHTLHVSPLLAAQDLHFAAQDLRPAEDVDGEEPTSHSSRGATPHDDTGRSRSGSSFLGSPTPPSPGTGRSGGSSSIRGRVVNTFLHFEEVADVCWSHGTGLISM